MMNMKDNETDHIENGWKITLVKQPTFAQALILAYEWLLLAKADPDQDLQEIAN